MIGTPSRPASRWTFWLLIAAWGCANSPQPATYAFLTWLAEARSFPHQQRLALEVATLLGGAAPAEQIARHDPAPPAKPPPAVPPEAVLKKLSLSLERTAGAIRPAVPSARLPSANLPYHGRVRPPPLLGPPRSRLG